MKISARGAVWVSKVLRISFSLGIFICKLDGRKHLTRNPPKRHHVYDAILCPLETAARN